MIILENDKQITDIVKKEKELISSNIETQNTLKSILLDYMQKLADSTDNVDIQYADTIINLLNDFKHCLELFKINIDLLNNLLKSLDNIELEFNNKNIKSENVNFFNKTFFETNNTVSKNTLQIETVLQSVLKYFRLFISTLDYTDINNIKISEKDNDEQVTEIPVNEKLIQSVDTDKIIENTLIISETKGKIFLPYTISLLNEFLNNNPEKYLTLEDVIEKEYTLPFDAFRTPSIARFRESFKLMRKKEKSSIKEAFDLGMELLFNYNLHPAIISACKNIDELDIYLDYLEANETDKFDCFKIIFDIAPILSKNKKN